jgi:hypothetical protein
VNTRRKQFGLSIPWVKEGAENTVHIRVFGYTGEKMKRG